MKSHLSQVTYKEKRKQKWWPILATVLFSRYTSTEANVCWNEKKVQYISFSSSVTFPLVFSLTLDQFCTHTKYRLGTRGRICFWTLSTKGMPYTYATRPYTHASSLHTHTTCTMHHRITRATCICPTHTAFMTINADYEARERNDAILTAHESF